MVAQDHVPTLGRRILFLSLPYAVIALLLWGLNLLLPHLDSSLDPSFTHELQLDGRTYTEINRKYLAPFFPAGSPIIPEVRNSLLRPEKGPETFRVLCLGESSMFGVPFGFSVAIPSLVRKQLRHLYPGKEIEVVNLGASAINTNVIRAMVPQFLTLQPDLVLIYTGHNEFYGPDGVGAPWIERQIPALTRWKYRLRRLPLVMGLQRLIAGHGDARSGAERNLMRQVSEGAEVTLEGTEAGRIFDLFEENLRAILRGFRDHGVPVIIGEISSNLSFPPFAPHPAGASDPVRLAIESGRPVEAESLLAAAAPRNASTAGKRAGDILADSLNAYLLYWHGRLSLARGDSAGAHALLERARDHDLLKFRAPGRVNTIIHALAREESATLVPVDSLLQARSPLGITDTTFFTEHVHPTFRGYDQISRMFVEAILARPPGRLPSAGPATLLPLNADTLSVPRLDLGFGAFSLLALTSRWPFTEMPRRHDLLEGYAPWELDLVKQVYSGAIGWTDALLQYAQEAKAHQQTEAMVTALSALVEEYPERPVLQHGLAAALEAAGRPREAIAHYRLASALGPIPPQGTIDFAFLLIDDGQDAEAEKQLRAILSAAAPGEAAPGTGMPDMTVRAEASYGLAVIAANKDSLQAALRHLEDALRLAPGYGAALALRSQIMSNIR